MTVLQILLQIWQSAAEQSHKIWAVNWFLKNFSIVFLAKALSDFFWGGRGGGGCKKCWVRQREGEGASLARFPL